jgi:cellulose synthase/poly-beta-1,6-N-acetylglucosamine synthase-like glycosyltransferase
MNETLANSAPAPSEPQIGVVIIGRNEGERLRACLTSVFAMNYPGSLLDVIYVDSSSSDGSVALAESMGVKTIVLDGPTTAARGRNAGWAATDAPFILFLDGDTLLHPEFVATALPYLADESICGVYGNRREMRTDDSIYNAIFDMDWNAASSEGSSWSVFFGGDALVRRAALESVGGYNPLLIAGEEPDLCRRMRGLGNRILHIDVPMTLHDLAMYTIRQYWRRSVRTGYAYAEISSMYANTNDPLWSAESRSNHTRGVFWTCGPAFALLLALLMWSLLPIVLFLLIALALFARTAMKVRGRTHSAKLLLAYSVHSHLQQIPIFFGQLRYRRQRQRGGRAAIIEYKSIP